MAGSFLTQAVFVFLQIKILTHWLDPAEYGLFSAVFAFGALLSSFAELGFSVVLTRYGAKFDAEGRPEDLAGLLKLAVGLWMLAGGLISVALWLSRGAVAAALGRPGITPELLALGFVAVLTFSSRAFASAAFQGRRRMLPALALDGLYMVGITLGYLLFRNQLSASRVLWILLAWSSICGAGGLLLFLGQDKATGVAGRAGTSFSGILSEVRVFWGGAFATTVLAIALESADRLVLAALLPFEMVAAYHVAGRIHLFVRKVLYIPQQVAKPELAFKWERGAAFEMARDLGLFSKLEWALGVAVAVPIVLLAPVGIVLASNRQYLSAVPALVALAGSLPVLCLQAPLTTFLRATDHIWVSVTGEAIWLGASLLFGLALLPAAGLGGFASGQIVAAVLTLLYTAWSLRKRGLPRPTSRFLMSHGLVALLLWGLAALWTLAAPIESLAKAIVSSLSFIVLLNVVLVRFHYFSPQEEERLLSFLGTGGWSRVGRFLLTWPRRGEPAAGEARAGSS
jgi:O-antigen/teichoic acid export membrane protein